MIVTIKATGLDDIRVRMNRVVHRTAGAVDKINDGHQEMLLGLIRENIMQQGLVETGGYLDSWVAEKVGKTGFSVYTNRPDAMRHEFGFVGRDSLGRVYDEAPRPHVRPAREVTFKSYQKAMSEVVPRLWGS